MANEQLLPWINSAGADGERNSMVSFPCDGKRTAFEFNFAGGYITKGNIKAYTYEVATGLTSPVSLSASNFLGPNTLSVTPAIPAGFYLVVYRDTQKTVPLVNYATGAVMDEKNLDMSNQQAVFVAAEMVDRFDAINASSTDAVVRSVEAVRKADEALTASGQATSDASEALTASRQAVSTANEAKVTADGIDAKATQAMQDGAAAVITANAAKVAADDANVTAHGIDAKAQQALDNSVGATNIATNAQSVAQSASATANGVDAKAQTALTTVTTAMAGATWIRGLQGGNNSKWVGGGNQYNLFDLSFTSATIGRPSGFAPVYVPGARVRIDLRTVGAGGWDVAGSAGTAGNAFLYLIVKADGAGTVGIASKKDPGAGGPTLPAGYVAWAFAAALEVNTGGFRFNMVLSKDTMRYYQSVQFADLPIAAGMSQLTNYPLAGQAVVSEHFGVASIAQSVSGAFNGGSRAIVQLGLDGGLDSRTTVVDSALDAYGRAVASVVSQPWSIPGTGVLTAQTLNVPDIAFTSRFYAYVCGYKLYNNAI